MLKTTARNLRGAAIGSSIGIVGVAAHIWNRPWDGTGITSLYTLIIVLLFIFLIAMIMTDAGEKRKNFNAILLLATSTGARLFAIAKFFT
ncbi:hypothetical protein [Pontiella sulfatireligans]|uniref:Uncharacterized protein n=1 Tax=Pontiella sulfatireligans TaxID=2750658 RepID=A0A6C2UQN7_9BACT|nr:hypothetical protein [Pontiella sulfatireligans]VGO22528.1 hypothetical protein SCARR_04612 [Pontiella sulfatireligans]